MSQTNARLKEAEKLGFSRAVIPKARLRKGRPKDKVKKVVGLDTSLIISEIDHLADLVAKFASTDQRRDVSLTTRAIAKNPGKPS